MESSELERLPRAGQKQRQATFPEREGAYLLVMDMLVLQQHRTIRADRDKAGNSEQQFSQSDLPRATLGSLFLALQPRDAATHRDSS